MPPPAGAPPVATTPVESAVVGFGGWCRRAHHDMKIWSPIKTAMMRAIAMMVRRSIG
jgi:hypothetical protein